MWEAANLFTERVLLIVLEEVKVAPLKEPRLSGGGAIDRADQEASDHTERVKTLLQH